MILAPEMFLAPNDLRQPYNSEWKSAKPIAPGQEQTLEKPGIHADSAQGSLVGCSSQPRSGTKTEPHGVRNTKANAST